MSHRGTARRLLAVLGLVLLAGCSVKNGTNSDTELSISGDGNEVFISDSETFHVQVPAAVTTLEVRFTAAAGYIEVHSGPAKGPVTGALSIGAISVRSGASGTGLTIDVRGREGEPGKAAISLPVGPQATLRIERGSGNLLLDLDGLHSGRVFLENHTGNATLAIPRADGAEVQIEGGAGTLVIKTTAAASIVIRANGTPVKVPASFRPLKDGGFASPSYAPGSVASTVTIQGYSGTVEVQAK